MAKGAATGRYEPGPAFEEVDGEAVLDISTTDSKEFWLIQWPKDKVSVSDFHRKEISLKLHNDGNLGTLESSSGKSYDLVSFASQQPDATVFLPSGSETKAVGKISRRVCLVHYPNPEELEEEKPNLASLTPSVKKSAGSSRKTMSRFTGFTRNHSSQGSAMSMGQTPKHKKRKDESSLGHSNVRGKTSEGSHARGAGSNTATATTPQSTAEKSKKKVRIVE